MAQEGTLAHKGRLDLQVHRGPRDLKAQLVKKVLRAHRDFRGKQGPKVRPV